ncbi:MAG: hypothetical protein JWM11_2529 [Planctomycetaceae bacterium]|nr:hypothetical protein [Planctomycetaceae bacterium]
MKVLASVNGVEQLEEVDVAVEIKGTPFCLIDNLHDGNTVWMLIHAKSNKALTTEYWKDRKKTVMVVSAWWSLLPAEVKTLLESMTFENKTEDLGELGNAAVGVLAETADGDSMSVADHALQRIMERVAKHSSD